MQLFEMKIRHAQNYCRILTDRKTILSMWEVFQTFVSVRAGKIHFLNFALLPSKANEQPLLLYALGGRYVDLVLRNLPQGQVRHHLQLP